jgi:general secretion pathway protein A
LQSGPELALALQESRDQLQDTVVAENKTAAENTVSTLTRAPANDTLPGKDDSVAVAVAEQAAEPDQTGEIATGNDSDRSSVLKELLFNEAENSKSQAYTDLFDVWNKKYDVTRHGNACSFAVENGLSCLHRQGNLRSLAILNRPAVLKFYDDHNNTAYAIVTYLDNTEATLRRGNSTLTVNVDTLNEYWLGEYTLLWQKPPYYASAVQPGSQGPIVQWLDQQMVRLYGQNDVPTIRNTYNDELQSQVIRFQQSKGLIPDGVVGPHTFILLNSELELDTPLLNTRKG